MKKFLLVLAVGCIFAGCHSKLDLDNIDPKAQVDLGVALPLGSLHMTLNDIIGEVDKLYLDENDIITWKDTFSTGHNFHEIDLAERISTKEFKVPISDVLSSLPIVGGKISSPVAIHLPPLEFDMPIELTGFNDETSSERLDSVWIETSSFYSSLRTENFDIQWDWIDSIVLDLGEQISCNNGDTSKVIFRKGSGEISSSSFKLKTDINDFTLNMIKDRTLTPTRFNVFTNVLNKTKFRGHIWITIPAGEELSISANPAIYYELSVNFITFKAIWGYFSPNDAMNMKEEIDFEGKWGDLGFLKNSVMPFSNPQIHIDIRTQIAGEMQVRDCYLYSVDENGKRTHALFGADQRDTILRNVTLDGLALNTNPNIDPIGAICHRSTDFDKSQGKGQIDRMFGKLPKKVGYQFYVDFDTQNAPFQARMTPNDSIHVDAIFKMPLTFRDSIYFSYNDTTDDVNLSQISIDSLLGSSSVVDTIQSSNLKVIMTAVNDMPLSLSLSMKCYNAANQLIMDPEDNTKPFTLFDKDLYRIESADYKKTNGSWYLMKKNETTMIIAIDSKRSKVLPEIKKIIYSAAIDDTSVRTAIGKYDDLSLHGNRGVTLKLGVAADINAVLNFDKENKK